MLRRAVALLTLLFLAHLSIAGGSIACRMADAATTPAASATEHEHHDDGTPAPASDQHSHSGAPASTPGCVSIAACGLTPAIAGRQDVALDLPPVQGVPAVDARFLGSVARAPELPPPRA